MSDGMTNIALKSSDDDSQDRRKYPHICPVCGGNGLVPNGFYMQTSGHWPTTSVTPEMCRSCNGTGIVWEN